MKYLIGTLVLMAVCVGCETSQQHMQREQNFLQNDKQYAPIFQILGTEDKPASFTMTATNFSSFAFFQRVPQHAPIPTLAEKVTGEVGKTARAGVVAAATVLSVDAISDRAANVYTDKQSTTVTTTTLGGGE